MIRPFLESDIPVLKDIHARAGYKFEFPNLKGIAVGKTIVDEENHVIGFVGAQLEAQLIGMFDPNWNVPGERLRIMAKLHAPIAAQLNEMGVKEVYVACQDASFARRLMKTFGWKKALWPHVFLTVSDCLARFTGKAA